MNYDFKIFFMKRVFYLSLAVMLMLSSCCSDVNKKNTATKTQNEIDKKDAKPMIGAFPKTVIYKTAKDYSANVMVNLSHDKQKIVSYPAISDVKNLEKVQPVRLEDGFWLDQRGITKNAAVLSLSYEEYAALDKQPSAKELFELIIDDKPITAYHKIKKSFKNEDKVSVINQMIRNGDFK